MKKNSFIKLECGTLVQVVATKEKCCDTLPNGFELVVPKVEDATTEKHVPYIRRKRKWISCKSWKRCKTP